jgi:hypothetical protein
MKELGGHRARDLHRSVWNQTRHRLDPRQHGSSESRAPRKHNGNAASRLVAITATGPIYSYQSHITALPLAAALALTQELAARVIDPRAAVVSSLANRLHGESARMTWLQVCAAVSAQLMSESPRYRLTFLSEVLAYIHREDNINGIESILGAAINAAWPWVDDGVLERVFSITSKYLTASEFAKIVPIPIADPNNRTFSVFQPGTLTKVDLTKWLDWKMLTHSVATGTGNVGGGSANGDIFGTGGLLGPGTPGHRGVDLTGLQGADGNGPRGAGSHGDGVYGTGGLLGPGTPGHKGADLSGLEGADGQGPRRGGRDGPDIYGTGGLLGPGTPGHKGADLSGLQGADGLGPRGQGSDDTGLFGPGGLLGAGTPGHRGLDLSNLRGNGGPLGFGSAMGPGGVEDTDPDALDGMKATADTAKTFGGMLLAVGLATTMPAVAATGLVFIWAGDKISTNAKDWAQNPGGPPPAKTDQPPSRDVHDLPDAPTDVHKLPDAKPKHSDIYPFPDGTGGAIQPDCLTSMVAVETQRRYGMNTAAVETRRPSGTSMAVAAIQPRSGTKMAAGEIQRQPRNSSQRPLWRDLD